MLKLVGKTIVVTLTVLMIFWLLWILYGYVERKPVTRWEKRHYEQQWLPWIIQWLPWIIPGVRGGEGR